MTSAQVKRAQAAKVEKKEDNLGFMCDANAGAVKLEPLDPQYQHLIQEQLELIRKEKWTKFTPFGEGKLRIQNDRITTGRKFSVASAGAPVTSPQK